MLIISPTKSSSSTDVGNATMDCSLYLPRTNEDLKVEYDSPDYLVVNKTYDLHINTDNPAVKVSLQTQLEHHFPALANDALGHKFHFCHRLDFATSGLLCIAKNKRAAAAVSKSMRDRLATKVYLAIVRNTVTQEMLDITETIGEPADPETAKLRVCVGSGEKQRPAHTRLLLLQTGTYDGAAVSKVLLLAGTGRRHQLRAHLASRGHPVVGDYTYSHRQDTSPHRMMLHAYHLHIPTKGESVTVTSSDPLTEAMEQQLWRPSVTLNPLSEDTVARLVAGG